jgi:uncharacterized membrane protein
MEWLIIIGLAFWVWRQSSRISALTRRLGELETRAAPASPQSTPAETTPGTAPPPLSAPRREPLILDQRIDARELLLDTPIPEPSNDQDNTAAAQTSTTDPPAAPAEPLLLTEVVPLTPQPPARASPQRSFPYGEALAVLAIAAAFLAPPLTGIPSWPSAAVTLYVVAVGFAGFALAYSRRWPWASAATLGGLYVWFAAAIEENEIRRALAFICVASVGGVAMAQRGAAREEKASIFKWSQARQLWPSAAICIGSVLLICAWGAMAPTRSGLVAGPALIASFHVALAAYAIRARIAAPPTLAVSVAALVAGFTLYLITRDRFGEPGADLYPTILFAAFTVIASALGAKPHRSARAFNAGAGAIGSGLLTLLSASTRPDWHSIQAWAPLFAGAALLFAAAWRASRDVAEPHKDRAVNFWCAGAAILTLIGVESAFPAAARAMIDAGAALVFAAAFTRQNWRALRFAALTAAAIAVAHSLSPDIIDATLNSAMPLWRAILYLGATATALFAAGSLVARREPYKAAAESLDAASIFIILTAIFLALRWVAAGGAGERLDEFTETALRCLTLLAAGHIVLPRALHGAGLISRWRGHVLLGFGLIYALAVAGFADNPWWGGDPAQIQGPPIFDGLLLAFGAPAALALAAVARLYRTQRVTARLYAIAGGIFLLFWAALEIRRGFHASAMAAAPIGVFEGACYGLLALGMGLVIAAIPRLRAQSTERPLTHDLSSIASMTAWISLAFAVILMLLTRHPWWGAQDAYASDTLSTGLAVLAQMWAATLALALGRALSRGRGVDITRFAAAATAALFALSFGHAAIRWLYHGGAMDNRPPLVQLEAFAHTLWPLTFVLGASAITARAPGRDTVRAYLNDLEAIWSVAIWPALLFAALGLWGWFNPWWGSAPVATGTTPLLVVALATYPIAALLSLAAPRVPHAVFPALVARAATILAIGYILVGLTLVMRAIFHSDALASAPTSEIELWSYSAAWAVFGVICMAFGAYRNDPILRWAGIAILFVTAAKIFLVDSARLSGIIRALSFFGFGVVAILVAIATRRFRQAPPPAPGDLLKVIPSARRERRNVRR